MFIICLYRWIGWLLGKNWLFLMEWVEGNLRGFILWIDVFVIFFLGNFFIFFRERKISKLNKFFSRDFYCMEYFDLLIFFKRFLLLSFVFYEFMLVFFVNEFRIV